MPILLIEGPDLSGKTYAIDKIGKFFNSGFTIKNNFKPKEIKDSAKLLLQYHRLLNMIDEYQSCYPEQLILLDRFYISQQVYSILRGKDEMSLYGLSLIEMKAFILDMKLVYINTPLSILKKRYLKRGDEHIKIEQLEMLKKRYDKAYDLSILPKVKINTLSKDWLEKIKQVIG